MDTVKFITEPGRIWLPGEDGKALAEVTFPLDTRGIAQIDHTFVDESLRGQGIAGQLLEALAVHLKEKGLKAVPVCSYAVSWFQKHPDQQDLLA